MTATRFDSLRHTLQQLRRRRRNLFFLRQSSLHSIILVLLVLSISLLNLWLQPGKTGTTVLFALMVALAAGVLGHFIKALRRRQTDDRMLAHYVEDHIPDFEQRLLTSLEFTELDLEQGRAGVSTQFIQQLWEDAQQQVQKQQSQVRKVEPASRSWLSFATAVSTIAAVSVLFLVSDSLFRAGSRLAWPFAISEPLIEEEIFAAIEISVEPGDIEIQRGESVTIIAQVSNAMPDSISLRLQDDRVNWRNEVMQRDGSGSDSAYYSYFIPALQQDTTYYISFNERGEQSSQQYRISVYDLPQVDQLDLAFEYPDYTGIEDNVETDSGDMVVPEGTVVNLNVTFNKAIEQAVVQFDQSYSEIEREEQEQGVDPPPYIDLPLTLMGNTGSGRFTVNQDGVYRIFATDFAGLQSQNPSDYFIRAIEDMPPELVLQRPGRDQEVMPLEEVVLEVNASDDYGLSEFKLNYSVVGSDEVEVNFLPDAQVRQVTGHELIYLEDLAVEPGDFVSYFLTLADNNALQGPSELISDIYFLQIIPTDQEFRRNPGMGGGQGGGGSQGGDSSALVAVQKDIIAATWKLRNRHHKVTAEEFASDAQIIAEAQREATGRARRSIDRLAERLNFSDDTYDAAVENLSLAIEQMNMAASELELAQITSALPPEQLALQFILRAETSINRTNISMQQGSSGGGGGGARQEREDLRELFEMEMGQLENRYENPASAGGSRENQAEVDKLKELARRQESLTRAQRNLARRQEQLSEEQKRRELERLTRQQEQLSQEVAQLAQQMSQQQSSSTQNSSRSSSGADGNGQQAAQQSTLQRAARQMQEAAASDSPAIAAARSQKALENLRQQQQELTEEGRSSVQQLAQTLTRRGQQLLDQQRQLMRDIAETSRQQGLGQTRQAVRDDDRLQELIAAQQQQQTDLKEIETMLRAIIARGSNEDQRLLSQAQSASRELRPIQEGMQTSNRVLRNGMVNLAVDIEGEIEGQMSELARSLAALDASGTDTPTDRMQQAANDAEALRQQIEDLQQQALAFNQAGQQVGGMVPSLRKMRDQLQLSEQLAEQLQQQLQESGGQAVQAGLREGRQQLSNNRPNDQARPGIGGGITNNSSSLPWGNVRSIRQQLTRQDIEDFLNQPELFRQLLEPIIELEGALSAQAELDAINNKLFATENEEIPEQYRDLVQQYYRVLSESQGPNL
ncbi:MAG: hypothetical protein OXD01_03795 [Gammaproteobacteria bacterium]|nr:hypothetical protein [Gammaproteobacteria bacterium]